MRRTGIDLYPSRCIVVDAEGARRRSGKDGEPKPLRIRASANFWHTNSPDTITTELKALRESRKFPAHAWVNLWDVPSSHQYLLLGSGTRAQVEDAARRQAQSAKGTAAAGRDAVISVAVGRSRLQPGGKSKTEALFVAASLESLRRRLQPIVDAGFTIDGVTTPSGALWAQAQLRKTPLRSDVHAYVALSSRMSSLAIVADGFLLYARDFSWGYTATAAGVSTPLHRDVLANRLTDELRRAFLYVMQFWEHDVSQLVLCGDMPDLRSLTAPLIERLNIEVETLDTLQGIDTAAVPDSAGAFYEHVAAYRLALAIASSPPPVNLLPPELAATGNSRGRLVTAAGSAAAAIALALLVYSQVDLEKAGGGSAARSAPSAPVSSARVPGAPVSRAPVLPPAVSLAPAASAPAPPAPSPPAPGTTPVGSVPREPEPITGAPPKPASGASALASPTTSKSSPAVTAAVPATQPMHPPAPSAAHVQTQAQPRVQETGDVANATPDPVVKTILYSESRRLALVNGRIVKAGDRVGDLFVEQIERDAVILTSPKGLRKRIALDRPTARLGRQ